MSSYISLPMFGANIGERLRLEAARCQGCSELIYPQRPQCPNCNGTDFQIERLSGEGTLYTYTVIARGGAPAEFDDQQTMTGSIVVGVVELREGPRLMAQIADADLETLTVGTPLRATIRRLYDQEGVVRYGTKFVPVAS